MRLDSSLESLTDAERYRRIAVLVGDADVSRALMEMAQAAEISPHERDLSLGAPRLDKE